MSFNEVNARIGNYRWGICAILFFATTVNYIDRSVISMLKDHLSEIFSWTEGDYSNLVISFQIAYAVGLVGAGALIDKLGTKIGYALTVGLWSVASALHGFATGTWGFIGARAMLGVCESGAFPSSNKAVAEWYPRKERALATGLYNSGSNIGAIVAPLLIPWMLVHWGWQYAFWMTGALGAIWLVLWFIYYEKPRMSKHVKPAELAYIENSGDEPAASEQEKEPSVKWVKLLGRKQTWAFVTGKFFSDPIWWFFLFWLPSFLHSEYGLKDMDISLPLIVVYTLSSAGSILGGWFPKLMIDRGRDVSSARKLSMFIIALVPLLVLFTQRLGSMNMWFAIVIIGLACAAHCAWQANLFATVSDMFPKKAIASVTGIGSMAGAVGGILIAKMAGLLFDHFKALGNIGTGYEIMFVVCAVSYIVAWLIMHVLVKHYVQIKDL